MGPSSPWSHAAEGSQVAWWQPLPKGHWPLRRQPPSTRTARPWGTSVPAITAGWIWPGSTSAKIRRLTSWGTTRTVQNDAVAMIMVTQPTEGLAVDSVSMTLAAVTGSAPRPPCSGPVSRWKNPASASLSASQSGTRLASSMASAASRISGSSPSATASRSREAGASASGLDVLMLTSPLAATGNVRLLLIASRWEFTLTPTLSLKGEGERGDSLPYWASAP